MLADSVDVVIGVDTHRDQHAIAAVTAFNGAVRAQAEIATTDHGYQEAIRFADTHAAPRRAWAVEGTGSYGADLARFLHARGERVIEIHRPAREQHTPGKNDQLDAVRAARTALGRSTLARPRVDHTSDALRVLLTTRQGAITSRTAALNELRALIVTAPDELRSKLRNLTPVALITHTRRLRTHQRHTPHHRARVLALRGLANRVAQLTAEADLLEREITSIVTTAAPALLNQPGIGPLTCAQLLISWSHPGRIHSQAAFARLAGAAPIPASSGNSNRHRLDRGGDRQLNRALHTIAVSRLKTDPATIAYADRRTAAGHSRREIIRCIKRYLARSLWRQLEHQPHQPPPTSTIGPCS
jgi:transposase